MLPKSPLLATLSLGLLVVIFAACAPPPRPVTVAAAPSQATAARDVPREADEYTRYELLDPGSAQFHILFEVTAITPGATVYFNPIRKGSVASGESVRDRATSLPLSFEVVSGAEARKSGLPEADLDTDYIRVHLPHPVPPEGGVRLLIEKTYKDVQSYHVEGTDRIVFSRPLGIRHNAVVLPAGYEIVSLNIPSQIRSEPAGSPGAPGSPSRLVVSFMHTGPDAAPLVIEARRIAP